MSNETDAERQVERLLDWIIDEVCENGLRNYFVIEGGKRTILGIVRDLEARAKD